MKCTMGSLKGKASSCLCFIITSLMCVETVQTGETVVIDLSNLNSTMFKLRDFINGSAAINIKDNTDFNTSALNFFVLQMHSFKSPLFIQKNDTDDPITLNGTNIGILQFRGVSEYHFHVTTNNNATISVLIVLVTYGPNDPQPGGCNLSFETENAPYQRISYSDAMIRVDAQPAGYKVDNCGDIEFTKKISYQTYHMYVEEQDFTTESYFVAIEKMLTARDIIKNGRKVEKPNNLPEIRRYFNKYQGVVTVHAIIATTVDGHNAAYIPTVSFGCDVHDMETCSGPLTVCWKIICAIMVFYGVFMCFLGHRFFQINLFCTGFFVAAMLTYIVVSYSNISEAESWLTLGIIGFLYGAFWLIVWWKLRVPILSVTLSYYVTGLLIAGIFYYVGPADRNMFRNDANYWIIFLGISCLVHVVLLIITHWPSNAIATAFVGAYIFIVPFDFYAGGTLRYIFLNVIRRATVPKFNLAIIDPPFQNNEFNLLISWLLVSLLGMYIQWRHNRGRAPFPPPNIRDHFQRSRLEEPSYANETTPLILAESVRV